MTTIRELAEQAFEASERLHALRIMNTPQDYEERKQAFIELVEAQEAEAKAHGMLEGAIKASHLLALSEAKEDSKP